MHLLAPLVSGVRNAEDGFASVLRRGTSTLATIYSSFEGDAYGSSGIDSSGRVLLDAYGRAEVYVDELVDVAVYDAEGLLQVEFTAGVSASAIEVRSSSFTGQDWEGGASATGEPTTLKAVLDLWLATNLQDDWGVTLPPAPYYVVTATAYGATGNGVTNDATAINAAIAAASLAGGGVVFFPAGTYRLTSALVLADNITLLGSGDGSVIHGDGCSVIDNSSDGFVIVQSLKLTNTGANLAVISQAQMRFVDCRLTAATDHVFRILTAVQLRCEGCLLEFSGTSKSVVYSTVDFLLGEFVGCEFSSLGGGAYTGVGMLYCNNARLRDCEFGVSHTSGTLICYASNSGSLSAFGSIEGCTFPPGNGGTSYVTGISLDHPDMASEFVESGNIFPAAIEPDFTAYDVGPSADGTAVQLRTRQGRVRIITDNSATVDLPTDQYGTVILKTTHAAPALDGSRPPAGATGRVFVYHPSGGAGTVTLGSHFFGASAVVATANLSTHVWEYACLNVNATLRMVMTVDGFSIGTGI